MVIAMVAVSMVKTTVHEVVDVIAMRHCFVAAAGTVLVPVATDLGRTANRVPFADLDDVLVDEFAVLVVQMSVLKIVDVVSVSDGEMTAMGAMMVSGACGRCHSGILLLIGAFPRLAWFLTQKNANNLPQNSGAIHPGTKVTV